MCSNAQKLTYAFASDSIIRAACWKPEGVNQGSGDSHSCKTTLQIRFCLYLDLMYRVAYARISSVIVISHARDLEVSGLFP